MSIYYDIVYIVKNLWVLKSLVGVDLATNPYILSIQNKRIFFKYSKFTDKNKFKYIYINIYMTKFTINKHVINHFILFFKIHYL